ncbi:MAG: trypsin-like serine protease [Myxococcota bacterium]
MFITPITAATCVLLTGCAEAPETEAWSTSEAPPSVEPLNNGPVRTCPNTCVADEQMIIGCDNREPRPESTDPTTTAPWRYTGKIHSGQGTCTGALIEPGWVLSAAHCFESVNGPVGFALAQKAESPEQRPFGTHSVERIYIPRDYIHGNGSEENNALDYALLKLNNHIPGSQPANWGYVPWNQLSGKKVRAVGYPGDNPPPDGGWVGRAWKTGPQALHGSQPYRWLDGGEKGLLLTKLDGSGGQSGSPVYSFIGGNRILLGVQIGSPVSACQNGEHWVTRLTPDSVDHIDNVVDGGLDFFWSWQDVPYAPDAGEGDNWP